MGQIGVNSELDQGVCITQRVRYFTFLDVRRWTLYQLQQSLVCSKDACIHMDRLYQVYCITFNCKYISMTFQRGGILRKKHYSAGPTVSAPGTFVVGSIPRRGPDVLEAAVPVGVCTCYKNRATLPCLTHRTSRGLSHRRTRRMSLFCVVYTSRLFVVEGADAGVVHLRVTATVFVLIEFICAT